MELARTPLQELWRRARSAASVRELRPLARALGVDTRAGAEGLAEFVARRVARLVEERHHQAQLFARRRRLRRAGASRIAGVDEAGVGPLAGPVVAAAVVLPDRVDLPGLDDSKRLSRGARERLAALIQVQALALAVGEVWPEEIERINVYQASLEAMRRAVVALTPPPDHVLVDARTLAALPMPQTALVGGDARDGTIAAASIAAKVHRDALMRRLDAAYPGYGFAHHMGYATAEHLAALRRLGPSPVHRRSFGPVMQLAFW